MTRLVFFRIFTTLFGVLCALLTIGSITEALSSGGPGSRTHVLLLAHGALMGTVFATGFLVQLHRPATRVAAWQMVLVAVLCMEGVGLAYRMNDPLFEIGFPVALVVTGLLHPARSRLLRTGPAVSPLLAPLALLAAVPLVAFTVHLDGAMAGLDGDLLFAVQAGADVAVTIPFVALVAALRATGWRLPAWSAASVAVVYGLASVAYPEEIGSLGRAGGLVTAGAALAFVAIAQWEAARDTGAQAPVSLKPSA